MGCAVLTSVDRTHQDEGIITLKISYTGTTDETRQAREEALQNEMQSRASTPQQSSIRDHTGSGVGNNPDDHKQTKQSKVSSVCGNVTADSSTRGTEVTSAGSEVLPPAQWPMRHVRHLRAWSCAVCHQQALRHDCASSLCLALRFLSCIQRWHIPYAVELCLLAHSRGAHRRQEGRATPTGEMGSSGRRMRAMTQMVTLAKLETAMR